MLFRKKQILYIQFKYKSIYYMIIDPQKNEIIEHDSLSLDIPVLIEGQLTNEMLVQKTLELFVREKKLRNTVVHFILPDHFSVIRKEQVPLQLEQKEIKEYLYLQLDSKIKLPFDSPVLDFQLLETLEDAQEILLVAYPEEYIQSFQKLFESVQLVPEIADLSYLSVYRLFKKDQSNEISPDEHLLLIQWHPYDSSLTVFHKDVPQFNRQTNFQRIAQSWEQDSLSKWEWTGSEEELEVAIENHIDTIERFLDFYKYSIMNGEKMVTRIILTGDFPEYELLYERISNRIDIRLSKIEVPSNFTRGFVPLIGLKYKDTIVTPKSKSINNHRKGLFNRPFKKTVEEIDAG
ncbi:type IV pilus biogenesis protein PilM [Marinilactibacillus sp. Marseille-P9653]|uniref:type IV pilus biogenesis protein PilM n=1 Tax=Marinilactibacillus sp. Marseille-P9653 TaxID=2866583 RepID=UPI001CE420C2|nr:pilus assembly protein PilM [Marinilactibacillus sp. Marseille-P9653]